MTGTLTTVAPIAEAIVDLDAVAHNTRVLARAAAPSDLMAVVKADGFGHGVLQVAATALANGASWLGVTSRTEALAVRAAGIDAPMLSWLHLPDEDFAPLISAAVDISCASPEHLLGVAGSAARLGAPARVQLKVDTGLSRGGAPMSGWPEVVGLAAELERAGVLQVTGVWSHLATADDPAHPSLARQVAAFDRSVQTARSAGLRPGLLHLANSAAILGLPHTHYDLVRAGIGIYGGELTHSDQLLRPAMTLRARAIMVKRVPAGTGVSYHHDHRTARETTLVLVPLGFADGVPRCVTGVAQVSIAGNRYPIVGRIAMDQFVVDVGDAPVRIGDEVLLFGPGAHGEPTVNQWAGWAGTNPHEILTGVGARVPRRYLPQRHTAPARIGATVDFQEWGRGA